MTSQRLARFARLAPALAVSMVLSACASAPKPMALDLGVSLESVRDEDYSQVRQYVNVPALQTATHVGLPIVEIADGAYASPIGPDQAALVANRAGRDLCLALARVFHVSETDSEGEPALAIRLTLTAIVPTSRGFSGASALLDVFVPGPFRLPAGFGALAASATVHEAATLRAAYQWAEGAGVIKEDARVSVIGDAYQLAGEFAKDFGRVMTGDPSEANGRRVNLSDQDRVTGSAACLTRFGQASAVGRAASFVLPLSPESIDQGAPEQPQAEPVSEDGID